MPTRRPVPPTRPRSTTRPGSTARSRSTTRAGVAVRLRGRLLRGSLLALGVLLVLAGCGGEERPDPAADAATRQWVRAYTEQLDRWADGAAQMAAAIEQRAWRRLGRVVRRMGRDGDRVRTRFEQVPASLAGARDLYARLRAAGDAASDWARVYRRDPPPYLANAAGKEKSRALADAAADFQAKVNRAVDALQ